MPDCDSILELLSARLDGELTPEEEQQLNEHLASCPECRALAENLDVLSSGYEVLREMQEPVPADFTDRVMERIRAQESGGSSGSSRKAVRPRKTWIRWAAGLAAALVLCAGIWRSGLLQGGVTPPVYDPPDPGPGTSASLGGAGSSGEDPSEPGPSDSMQKPDESDSSSSGSAGTENPPDTSAAQEEEEPPAPAAPQKPAAVTPVRPSGGTGTGKGAGTGAGAGTGTGTGTGTETGPESAEPSQPSADPQTPPSSSEDESGDPQTVPPGSEQGGESSSSGSGEAPAPGDISVEPQDRVPPGPPPESEPARPSHGNSSGGGHTSGGSSITTPPQEEEDPPENIPSEITPPEGGTPPDITAPQDGPSVYEPPAGDDPGGQGDSSSPGDRSDAEDPGGNCTDPGDGSDPEVPGGKEEPDPKDPGAAPVCEISNPSVRLLPGLSSAAPSAKVIGSYETLTAFMSQFPDAMDEVTGRYGQDFFADGMLVIAFVQTESSSAQCEFAGELEPAQGTLTVYASVPDTAIFDVGQFLLTGEIPAGYEDGLTLTVDLQYR